MHVWRRARAVAAPALAAALAALGAEAAHRQAAAPADLIVTGAIYTANPQQPRADAFAVSAGRIVAVGDRADIAAMTGPATTVLDVSEGVVVPGLHDAHGHVLGLGESLVIVDLRDTPSEAAVIDRIAARVRTTGAGQWVIGRGWDQNDWPDARWPTRAALDRVAPATPVALERIDGHASWVNSRALAVSGVTRETPDPPGGRLLRDAGGEPTGVLIDTAQQLVTRSIPPPTSAEIDTRILAADRLMRRLGVTMVHDAGASAQVVEAYRRLSEQGRLATRLYVMLDSDPATTGPWFSRGPLIDPSHRVVVRAVKLYADGALGSRGALLLDDYADEPGTRGLAVTPPARLEAVAASAVQAGFQVCTHAIGDRANREVLDLYERVARRHPAMRRLRPRIEHAQILDGADIPRFGRLGVIASVQPTHCTSDMPWVPARLGPARTAQGAYVWQKLLQSGARVASGSDFPVERADPMLGFHAAITRQDVHGHPPGGWAADQRMSREQALASFTSEAAYAAHAEADLGSIAAGRLADFVVLSRDIMAVTPAEVPATRVHRTFIAGRQVFPEP